LTVDNREHNQTIYEEEVDEKTTLQHKLLGFMRQWGGWTVHSLKHALYHKLLTYTYGETQFAPADVDTQSHKYLLSLRVTTVLNLLNKPLFWLGIALVVWLLTELLLGFLLTPTQFGRVQAVSGPVIAVIGPGAVGYFTNWLAIKMLFYPRRPNAVWWGLVPARREEITNLVTHEVMERLISPQIISEYLKEAGVVSKAVDSALETGEQLLTKEDFRADLESLLSAVLSQLVSSPEAQGRIRALVEKRILEWRGGSLNEKMIEWSKGIWGPKVLEELDRVFTETPLDIKELLPDLQVTLNNFSRFLRKKTGAVRRDVEETITGFLVEALNHLRLKEIVRSQLLKLDDEELERALTGNAQRELVFIQTFGGIFGLTLGLAMLYPLLRLAFVGIALGLWTVYRLTRTT